MVGICGKFGKRYLYNDLILNLKLEEIVVFYAKPDM